MQQPITTLCSALEASADATQRPGRPRGAVRSTVASALASGLVGGCDVLASHTGFPPESVRIALFNMLAAGQVHTVARAKHTRTRGRPRAVYAWVPVAGANQTSPLSWALAHVRTAWALPAAQTLKGATMPSDIQSVAAPQAKRYTPGPLSLSLAKGQADRMEALLAHMQRNGHANATARELCQAYERTYAEGETGGRMFPHTGMARMNNLEAAGRVVCDRDNKRICTVTGERVQVYSLPLQQVDWL